MSGGVDSSVAAARMVEAGHDVTGIHLALTKNPDAYRIGSRGCCSLEDSHDARRVADKLGIPFYMWDFADEFKARVVDNFVAEYQAGRTPNPCLRCNEEIKFAAVLERALALGYDAVATGHYARLERDGDDVTLHRALDPSKDQSYVLGVLEQRQLRHSLFPLGDSLKSDVRDEAEGLSLRVARKRDSNDICFIPDGDTAGYLDRALGSSPGDIVTEDGERLGTHDGTHHYTVGQRKGLNIGRPAPDGRPRYVLRIEPATQTVVVGERERLAVAGFDGIRPTWTTRPRLGEWRGEVQIRAHGDPVPATIVGCDDRVDVRLDEPIQGVAPGQAAVFFDNDRVVGSATIDRRRP